MFCARDLTLFALLTLIAFPAAADTVVVGDAEFHGRVEEKGDKILLHTSAGGHMTFPRSAVKRIIRSEETLPPPSGAEEPEPEEDVAEPAESAGTDDVLLSALPEMEVPFGGTAVFADDAFPIKAVRSPHPLQRGLRLCKAMPCRACRNSGEDFRKVTHYPSIPGVFMRKPQVITWKEPCSECGGYGDVFDEKFGDRCVKLVDALAHAKRGDKFASLRSLAAERLRAVFETRSKSWTTYHCVDVRKSIEVNTIGTDGRRHTRTDYVTVKEKQEAGKKTFEQTVADRVLPLWPRVAFRKPEGQAVVILGQVAPPKVSNGWTWAEVRPERGPQALLLAGGTLGGHIPAGRAVVGGLMVGRSRGAASGSLPIVLVVVGAVP